MHSYRVIFDSPDDQMVLEQPTEILAIESCRRPVEAIPVVCRSVNGVAYVFIDVEAESDVHAREVAIWALKQSDYKLV